MYVSNQKQTDIENKLVVTSGEREGKTRKGYEIMKYKLLVTEDEMVGWHQQLNGHEFELAPGVGDGQGGLACGSP